MRFTSERALSKDDTKQNLEILASNSKRQKKYFVRQMLGQLCNMSSWQITFVNYNIFKVAATKVLFLPKALIGWGLSMHSIHNGLLTITKFCLQSTNGSIKVSKLCRFESTVMTKSMLHIGP